MSRPVVGSSRNKIRGCVRISNPMRNLFFSSVLMPRMFFALHNLLSSTKKMKIKSSAGIYLKGWTASQKKRWTVHILQSSVCATEKRNTQVAFFCLLFATIFVVTSGGRIPAKQVNAGEVAESNVCMKTATKQYSMCMVDPRPPPSTCANECRKEGYAKGGHCEYTRHPNILEFLCLCATC